MEMIPWPVAYGIGGGSLILLFSFGTWFLRQLARGIDPEGKKHGLVTGSSAQALIDAEKARADDVIALYKVRDTEKSETIEAERTGRKEAVSAFKASVESNKILDDFFSKTRVVER